MCLATMAYVYAACAVRVTIFSTGGKCRLLSNFMELHALTLAARSYETLETLIIKYSHGPHSGGCVGGGK